MLKHLTILLYLMLLATIYTGCHDSVSPYNQQLIQAEQQMQQAPDSVYEWLQTLETVELSSADRSLYLLLRTEAEDKLYINHTTDSLITIARNYFDQKDDLPHLAKAWYLTGRIHSDWEEWDKATQDFLNAQKLTEDSEDYGLRGRIESQLGFVCFQNRLYDASQKHYKEAYEYFTQTTDNTSIASSLKSIGDSFLPQQKPDSIIFYYQAALDIAKTIRNERLLCSIYDGLGYIYIDMQQYEEALSCLKKAINSTSSFVPYYVFADLGKLYTKMGQLDSAKVYLQKILDCQYQPTRYMGYKYLAEIANLEGDQKTAFLYKEQEVLLQDSIEQNEKAESILTQQHRLQQQIHTKKTFVRINKVYGLLLVGLTGITITLIVRLYRRIRWKRKQLMLYKIKRQDLLGNIQQNETQIQEHKEIIETYKKQWKQLLEQTLQENREMETLKSQIQAMQEKNRLLTDQLHQLAIQECRQHSFLNSLYNDQNPPTAFTPAQWKNFNKAFDLVFPEYRQKFEHACPELSLNYQRLCYLLLLDLKLPQIARIMGLQTNSLSVYKNTIKKKYFSDSDNSPLVLQLRKMHY